MADVYVSGERPEFHFDVQLNGRRQVTIPEIVLELLGFVPGGGASSLIQGNVVSFERGEAGCSA